jgi:hypothetical protein
LRFAGEAVKKHPVTDSQSLSDSIREFILDLLVTQEKQVENA